jgi:hypothetical protein
MIKEMVQMVKCKTTERRTSNLPLHLSHHDTKLPKQSEDMTLVYSDRNDRFQNNMDVQMMECGHSLMHFKLHKYPQSNTMMELNMRSARAVD